MSDESTFTCGTCQGAEPVEYETRFQGQSICRECWKAHQVRSLTETRDLLYATRNLIRPAVDDSMPADESLDQAEVRAREMLANEAEVCGYQLYRLKGKDWATERIREAMAKAKAQGRDLAKQMASYKPPKPKEQVADAASAVRVEQCNADMFGYAHFGRPVTADDCRTLLKVDGVDYVVEIGDDRIQFRRCQYEPWPKVALAIERAFAKKPNVRHDADKEKALRILRSVVADRGDHRPIDWALAVLALGMLKEEESK